MKFPVNLIIAMGLVLAIPAANAVGVEQSSTDKPSTPPPREPADAVPTLKAAPDKFPPPPPSSLDMAPIQELSPSKGDRTADTMPPNADAGQTEVSSVPVNMMLEKSQHRPDAIVINVTPGHKKEVITLDLKKPDMVAHTLPSPAKDYAAEPREVMSVPVPVMSENRQHRHDAVTVNVLPDRKKNAIAVKPDKLDTVTEAQLRLPGAPPEKEYTPGEKKLQELLKRGKPSEAEILPILREMAAERRVKERAERKERLSLEPVFLEEE